MYCCRKYYYKFNSLILVLFTFRNEYQESSPGKGRPAGQRVKADNLTAICEPIVQKMSHNLMGLHRILQGWLYLSVFFNRGFLRTFSKLSRGYTNKLFSQIYCALKSVYIFWPTLYNGKHVKLRCTTVAFNRLYSQKNCPVNKRAPWCSTGLCTDRHKNTYSQTSFVSSVTNCTLSSLLTGIPQDTQTEREVHAHSERLRDSLFLLSNGCL
jgi:hypothetical protein